MGKAAAIVCIRKSFRWHQRNGMGIKKAQIRIEQLTAALRHRQTMMSFSSANIGIIFGRAKRKQLFFYRNSINITTTGHEFII